MIFGFCNLNFCIQDLLPGKLDLRCGRDIVFVTFCPFFSCVLELYIKVHLLCNICEFCVRLGQHLLIVAVQRVVLDLDLVSITSKGQILDQVVLQQLVNQVTFNVAREDWQRVSLRLNPIRLFSGLLIFFRRLLIAQSEDTISAPQHCLVEVT